MKTIITAFIAGIAGTTVVLLVAMLVLAPRGGGGDGQTWVGFGPGERTPALWPWTQDPRNDLPQTESGFASPEERREYIESLTPEEQRHVAIYDQSRRSVVNIRTFVPSVDFFFTRSAPTEGAGSGWVFDRNGHIVTNYHVIENSRSVEVTLHNGQTAAAEFVGADPPNDIAVLRIRADREVLEPVEFGDSSKLLVGQRIYAIGNPFGLEGTMTTGIISSLNRTLRSPAERLIRSVIQIDAALNRGNSGGPLLDSEGRLVGMNTAIASRVGENTGVGFAIPSNTVARVVPQLIERGRVIRASLGLAVAVPAPGGGVLFTTIPNGAAERAGLQGVRMERQRRRIGGFIVEQQAPNIDAADRILAIDGNRIQNPDDMYMILESYRPGDRVEVMVRREGERLDIPVVLEEE